MNPKTSCGVLNPPLRGIVQLTNSAALRFRNWSFNNKPHDLQLNTLKLFLCPDKIWLAAREKGALSDQQIMTANKAEILMRGFASVGIIALVDEATGYQEIISKKPARLLWI